MEQKLIIKERDSIREILKEEPRIQCIDSFSQLFGPQEIGCRREQYIQCRKRQIS